ncbi:ABC transporter substrate-binding protein [Bordetella hinzii]|uniref:ABC transporter substrate-binding protein n=1 Tax=Bordetella hinzii TaxID=103855 RepID=A0AAN1VGR7_9BORD|nr:ABC transporter substrate-binding protein [Bordetella hinzii]AKQ56698.1 cystine transporter subunit [Bordetella hinzii]AKQ61156.1 cystine transporter subunit [Bordetella hinzii]AZW17847.1 ABC transporter substrate-binding protein [Bordetella hinzii]KCB30916.1 ABC transporter, substrate-binding protein, family 3 [Bordetella hinzii L60]KCB39045.1 ABC transporter, substrate-binding protein, family 3 [Bordetella hinzii CA90 BAL1384]
MKLDDKIRAAFLREGKLRASINVGNPILARRDEQAGAAGVSVDLAREFAKRLEAELDLVVFASAGESVEAVAAEKADIGFFAIDPKRGEQIAFTHPYVIIEGAYLVREDSPVASREDVDREGLTVMVGKGSAYDLYLSRELRHASIARAPTSPAVVETFLAQGADVAAGVRQQLQADARRLGGLRMLEGHFMLIRQAMGLPKSRGQAAHAYLASFVEQMKATGFVAAALQRHGIEGAAVAGPGDR